MYYKLWEYCMADLTRHYKMENSDVTMYFNLWRYCMVDLSRHYNMHNPD